MDTKLTLKLNKRSIDAAKKYAKKNKKSLSAIVEDYFNIISSKEKNSGIEISPNVLELSGVITINDGLDIKAIYGKHLEGKYS